MKIPQRRAVSPIIATLLLIAIAVASGVIVYVFTGSLAGSLTKNGGSQISEQVEMLAYNFMQVSGAGSGECAGATPPCVIVYLENTGSSTITIGSVFIDGIPLVEMVGSTVYTTGALATISPQTSFQMVLVNAITTCAVSGTSSPKGDCFSSTTALPTSLVTGSSHLLKITTQAGGSFSFTVVAGSTG